MKILRLADLTDTPWKNGGGITREIVMAQTSGQMVWRLSRADVAQDGAFSAFHGLTRTLTIVNGGDMDLEHPGGTIKARLWVPVCFGGGLSMHARLKNGPLTDLNLMFDPHHCDGNVEVHRGAAKITFGTDIVALHVLAGKPVISGTPLSAGDSAFPDGDSNVTLAQGDALLAISIRYLRQSDEIKLSIATR